MTEEFEVDDDLHPIDPVANFANSAAHGAGPPVTVVTPSPAEVAIEQNYWTISIRALDSIIDRLDAQARLFTQSDHLPLATAIRNAEAAVRSVRDDILARNYEKNRKAAQ